ASRQTGLRNAACLQARFLRNRKWRSARQWPSGYGLERVPTGAQGRVAGMADVENESDESLSCGVCRKVGQFTAPVSVILVFAPGMAKPYPLIPAEDYRVCSACDAIFTLVNRAVEAHPTTRAAGPWTRAIVVFSDGHGVDVKAKRQGQQVALA